MLLNKKSGQMKVGKDGDDTRSKEEEMFAMIQHLAARN